ncbi:MAG: multiheme c-type cytochrome [Candidatus Krumholzibacteria bacterium]|nr:multiheme c-type cytochrome [Candidatus Krumholzibacteria bacterium]
MKKQALMSITLVMVGIFLLGMASVAFAGPEIVGAPKCKTCHKAKTGDQWAKWEGSKHAGAFATLGTDAAKAIATEKGLGDPQKEEACLKCHVTQAFLGRDVVINAKGKYLESEGVGCESCHGAGSDYKSKKVMKDHDASIAAGMTRDKSEEFCVKCHNAESPTFVDFVFADRWAEIAHPVPEK